MILFFKRETGEIFAVIDGRIHDEKQIACKVSHGEPEETTGKYVLGWIKKGKEKIECNLDQFELLQEFESLSPVSPLDYKVNIETGKLEKK